MIGGKARNESVLGYCFSVTTLFKCSALCRKKPRVSSSVGYNAARERAEGEPERTNICPFLPCVKSIMSLECRCLLRLNITHRNAQILLVRQHLKRCSSSEWTSSTLKTPELKAPVKHIFLNLEVVILKRTIPEQ